LPVATKKITRKLLTRTYWLSNFTPLNEHTIPIKIKETDPDEIRAMLLSKKMEGTDLGIEKKEMQVVRRPCDDNLTVPDTINKK